MQPRRSSSYISLFRCVHMICVCMSIGVSVYGHEGASHNWCVEVSGQPQVLLCLFHLVWTRSLGSLLVVHSFQGFSCFHTHLAVGEWGLQMCTTVLGLHGSGDSNQGSHASSLTEPSPQPCSLFYSVRHLLLFEPGLSIRGPWVQALVLTVVLMGVNGAFQR